MSSLVCGIDEAGRGPVIGPMVMGCALFDSEGKKRLAALGVRDSKKLSVKKRLELEPLIKDLAVEWNLVYVSPAEIDRMRKTLSLNQIEAVKTADMIRALENVPDKILVDAADSVAENYRQRIISCLTEGNEDFRLPEIIAEHKADDRYVEVGAASVLAKVARDREIEKLKESFGDFGSGYPSDSLTQDFVRKLMREGELPDCVRRSWNTVDRSKQTRLFDF